jgi:hypothetical protein
MLEIDWRCKRQSRNTSKRRKMEGRVYRFGVIHLVALSAVNAMDVVQRVLAPPRRLKNELRNSDNRHKSKHLSVFAHRTKLHDNTLYSIK